MNPQIRHEIFTRWRAANPHPKSDLTYDSTFELLVAVILSAQATDKGVNAATRKLYPVANTPEKILALGEAGLMHYISTIGLYRAKAKNVIATCRMLIEQHGSVVPGTREALEALPGVGRKTANVVLNMAFGEPTIAVDTHNFRVANRTGMAPGKTVEIVERRLNKFVPDEFKQHAHHWLILHGRYTCKAIKPDCPACGIAELCEFKQKTPKPEDGLPAKRLPPKRLPPRGFKAKARKLAPAKPLRAAAQRKTTAPVNTRPLKSAPLAPIAPRARKISARRKSA